MAFRHLGWNETELVFSQLKPERRPVGCEGHSTVLVSGLQDTFCFEKKENNH